MQCILLVYYLFTKIEQNQYSLKQTLASSSFWEQENPHTSILNKAAPNGRRSAVLNKENKNSAIECEISQALQRHCFKLRWRRMKPNMQNSCAQSSNDMANLKVKDIGCKENLRSQEGVWEAGSVAQKGVCDCIQLADATNRTGLKL